MGEIDLKAFPKCLVVFAFSTKIPFYLPPSYSSAIFGVIESVAYLGVVGKSIKNTNLAKERMFSVVFFFVYFVWRQRLGGKMKEFERQGKKERDRERRREWKREREKNALQKRRDRK